MADTGKTTGKTAIAAALPETVNAKLTMFPREEAQQRLEEKWVKAKSKWDRGETFANLFAYEHELRVRKYCEEIEKEQAALTFQQAMKETGKALDACKDELREEAAKRVAAARRQRMQKEAAAFQEAVIDSDNESEDFALRSVTKTLQSLGLDRITMTGNMPRSILKGQAERSEQQQKSPKNAKRVHFSNSIFDSTASTSGNNKPQQSKEAPDSTAQTIEPQAKADAQSPNEPSGAFAKYRSVLDKMQRFRQQRAEQQQQEAQQQQQIELPPPSQFADEPQEKLTPEQPATKQAPRHAEPAQARAVHPSQVTPTQGIQAWDVRAQEQPLYEARKPPQRVQLHVNKKVLSALDMEYHFAARRHMSAISSRLYNAERIAAREEYQQMMSELQRTSGHVSSVASRLQGQGSGKTRRP